jgi:D-glycero-D-manno-heptose 1,7-bisphosphate phosphatase
MSKRYLLLDRDGTIIKEKHYLSDPDQVELIAGVAEGLRRASELNWGLVVVTNQSGIGRGYFDRARLEQVHARMTDNLAAEGIVIDGIYYCPHTPEDRCNCRKPEPGLIEQAAKDLGFDPKDSLMVGDKVCDLELGSRVGAKTVLVRSGYGVQVEQEQCFNADFIVDHAGGVAELII